MKDPWLWIVGAGVIAWMIYSDRNEAAKMDLIDQVVSRKGTPGGTPWDPKF